MVHEFNENYIYMVFRLPKNDSQLSENNTEFSHY